MKSPDPITGAIVRRVSEGPVGRVELGSLTGLGRAALAKRVRTLVDGQVLRESTRSGGSVGRPQGILELDPGLGVVGAVDLGARHSSIGVVDLSGVPIEVERSSLVIADGPEVVLDYVARTLSLLHGRSAAADVPLLGLAVGVPGPVEYATGRVVSPPIMPGWDGVSVSDYLADRLEGLPVVVDNDVNIMAIGEYERRWSSRTSEFLYVKVGTGIGSGLILGGELYRGRQGAAGDIGHSRSLAHSDVRCECGNIGCLEAVASGRALVRRLQAAGRADINSTGDLVEALKAGDEEVIGAVQVGGTLIGETLSSVVRILSPEVVVIGDRLAEASPHLVAAIDRAVRRSIADRGHPIEIVSGDGGDLAGIYGAARLATVRVVTDQQIGRWVEHV